MYMAKDVLRNHDRKNIELHIFATTGPDKVIFWRYEMRGFDWIKELEDSAEYFHDVSGYDVRQQAALIRKLGIHILIDWDGYSNNGVRAAGLFPQQPAPIQMLHQEYVGTMGAPYIQYMVSDPISSPIEYEHIYSEKILYMPNSFLANSFAHQVPEMSLPQYELDEEDNPPHNGCGGEPASFVFCSFNKHLKIEPSLFAVWLNILQQVPDSVLCLLEYPVESKGNIWKFVSELDPALKKRVRFQPFLMNPYDNQRRVVSMCSAVVDTSVYNGHTTSYDALWGGVPLVTTNLGVDIAARVGINLLTMLNLTELIAEVRISSCFLL
jgi:protein O-GlcNAc transferase